MRVANPKVRKPTDTVSTQAKLTLKESLRARLEKEAAERGISLAARIVERVELSYELELLERRRKEAITIAVKQTVKLTLDEIYKRQGEDEGEK